MPISTGVAAHTSLPSALTAAIGESIEHRDAIALTWLLRRQVPRVKLDPVGIVALDAYGSLERLRLCPSRFEVFDVTTDLGVPTMLCVQVLRRAPDLRGLCWLLHESGPEDRLRKIYT